MPTSLISIVALALVLGMGVFAAWKGGAAERIGAALVLANTILVPLAAAAVPRTVYPLVSLAFDALTAIGLLLVALRYASYWLGGAMLLYGLQFSLHSFYVVTKRPNDLLHAWVNNVNFLAVCLCLAIGTAVAWRQREALQRRRLEIA